MRAIEMRAGLAQLFQSRAPVVSYGGDRASDAVESSLRYRPTRPDVLTRCAGQS